MKKNISIPIKPLNKALDRAIKEKDLSNEDVVRDLGIYTAAAIGNYRKGRRDVPTDLVLKWKEFYKEDLMSISETFVSKEKTNVPHEIKNKLRDIDIIEAENYIGMHRRVYDSMERSLEMFQKLAVDAQKHASDLTQLLRSERGSGPPQG